MAVTGSQLVFSGVTHALMYHSRVAESIREVELCSCLICEQQKTLFRPMRFELGNEN